MAQRPFLKWAGGKYQILDKIKKLLPKGKRLIEPFVGSGAVFINTDFPKYLLAETNADLTNLYETLKKEGDSFIEYCQQWFVPENNNKQKYKELRDVFNNTEDVRLKSALFIYLNKHGFNGLCRYNKSGGFNVPFGSMKSMRFPEPAMKHFLKKTSNATFEVSDFSKTMKAAKLGDVVYCDPPYVAISSTSNFTDYSPGGFTMDQQHQLADWAMRLKQKGIPVLISNHDTKTTRELYKDAKITSFQVQRTISCDANKRTKVKELLALFS